MYIEKQELQIIAKICHFDVDLMRCDHFIYNFDGEGQYDDQLPSFLTFSAHKGGTFFHSR
jgi:hypothetical protein